MAGYDWEKGMSNNAVAAREQGLLPASQCARRIGVEAKFISANFSPVEYHHTGKYFNVTYFYSLEEVIAWSKTNEGREEITRWKRAKKNAKCNPPFRISNCTVTYPTYRPNRGRWEFAGEETIDNAVVTIYQGRTMMEIHGEGNLSMRKKISEKVVVTVGDKSKPVTEWMSEGMEKQMIGINGGWSQ